VDLSAKDVERTQEVVRVGIMPSLRNGTAGFALLSAFNLEPGATGSDSEGPAPRIRGCSSQAVAARAWSGGLYLVQHF